MEPTKEASLEVHPHGKLVSGEGWFVLNAREAGWMTHEKFGASVRFEGKTRFPQVGVNIRMLQPGQPNAQYHRETEQEDFLVLAGECLVILEGEERRLEAWDFVHCPAGTAHIFVGAGDGPCLILMLGARSETGALLYPVDSAALRHAAGVDRETPDPHEAYAGFEMPRPTPIPQAALELMDARSRGPAEQG